MISKNIDQMKIEISKHIAADAVIQGQYFDGEKGCFIGCLTHSDDALEVVEKYGLPLVLVRVCENIHEGLSEGEYQDFFSKIGEAIDVDGKDLSKVHWLFLKEVLENMPEQEPDIQNVIDPVISGMGLLGTGKDWDSAASAADYAADADITDGISILGLYASTAEAASYGAGAAAYASAYDDAPSAAGAAYAACVAYAADVAGCMSTFALYAPTAGAAAYADARIKQKEIMLRLLKEAPMAVMS